MYTHDTLPLGCSIISSPCILHFDLPNILHAAIKAHVVLRRHVCSDNMYAR